MLETSIIVFREVLEAAIIVGIIAAATRGIPGRKRWIVAGLLFGLLGSAIVAAFSGVIADFAEGFGQELFNAAVLGIAVIMLGWHNIWMSSHGAQLARQARQVGAGIKDGSSESSILVIVIGLAVLREGSETVLFLYGIAATPGADTNAMLTGGAIGILAGVMVGYSLYAGLLRIPLRWFFSATGLLVLLLAAGMAAQAARYLIQADFLPALATPLWDTSAWLPQQSAPGALLHNLIGYDARPAGMQLIFYVFTLATIVFGMHWVKRTQKIS